ncbi:NAD-dependent epimerase/dehydratase family protein [Pedobacter helvus]|uniref:NAD-dependent epimerase/dehydratase family protein n=1 Tax=Pedobacter helvus TaxID=2563444 RepID=A0ABW9JDV8_9SPHI|nr:SDR family oxidoreductase [Pedobacter ureilyticus]
MKKVLVTGAYGFLGRNVAKEFKTAGSYVVGIGHGKWYKDEYAKWGIDEWNETTITFEALLNINKKFDVIVHCGGSGSVGFSYENPYEDFQKSVQSTLSLLEYIRLQNANCKFIYPSSPAVQGNLGDAPILEDMGAIPVSPYGFHKKIAEELCHSYHNSFNIDVGIVRYFSIYGEGLKKQLLWDACRKIKEADNVTFFGTGKETRDWIHVSDAASLLRIFSENIKGFEIVNCGSGVSTEIEKVIALISKYFERDIKVDFNGVVKEGDPIYFWADVNKAMAYGWKPMVELERGLENYVKFFKTLYK